MDGRSDITDFRNKMKTVVLMLRPEQLHQGAASSVGGGEGSRKYTWALCKDV